MKGAACADFPLLHGESQSRLQSSARVLSQQTLHTLIEDQAIATPDCVAIQDGDFALTYREFNGRANQLAHYLRGRGIGAGQRVAICLWPAQNFFVSVLAVLKSGAACVPLDPNYPAERIAYMLEDVQPSLTISERGLLSGKLADAPDTLYFGEIAPLLGQHPQTNPSLDVSPADIAYVIYTSGSTGKPRGVLLRHAGLVNYNFHAARFYGMSSRDRVLQFCSVSFDIAVEEMFIAWFSGATLVLRSDEMSLAVPEFMQWIERNRITVLDLPTAYWHEWVHELSQLMTPAPDDLRLVIVGGEKPSSQAYAKWARAVGKRVRWVNTYGPTETSICATAFEPDADQPVPDNMPIGKELPNTKVYLLDEQLNPVASGEPGELHVAGVGVAEGYWNRPEITAEKFIPNPFAPKGSDDSIRRMYKTGDLARYLPSGDIEFLGRRDHQVKIRGFRIELGEIEIALAAHSAIRECVVVARDDQTGNKHLVAYFVPVTKRAPLIAELREFLSKRVPDHMVPSSWVSLDALPLTPNGKIDRKGLPDLTPGPSGSRIIGPSNELERRLVGIWQDVLGRKPIGIHDSFFDLGGHSLLAARLMHRIGQSMGQAVPLAVLFEAPTVAQLANALNTQAWSEHWSSLVPIQPLGAKPPLFCVHGVGGNVLGFSDLGKRMAPDYPLYGLQAQGLDGRGATLDSIEEMATHYIREIRSVVKQGPYRLAGFSFGGLVAYEMAQQLLADGEVVALLILFDTEAGQAKNAGTSLVSLLTDLSWRRWTRDLPKAMGKKIRRTVKGVQTPKILRQVRNTNRAAAERYILRPYPGKVTYVRATEKLAGSGDQTVIWRSLVKSLEVQDMASDHFDMLIAPEVDNLAVYLKQCMDRTKTPASADRDIPTLVDVRG